MNLLSSSPYSINELLFGGEEWHFILQVPFRALVMFVVVLFSLRILGKRGVKQLSVFELVIILTLGSAAGDPIFYKDVGLIPAAIVFVVITSLYRLVTWLIDKNETLEHIIEGRPVCLIDEGRFAVENFNNEPLAQGEFFAELRMNSVSHLGQVRKTYIETSGEISIFYYEDEDVRWGMPILPEQLSKKTNIRTEEGWWACNNCGNPTHFSTKGDSKCTVCKNEYWLKATKERRIR